MSDPQLLLKHLEKSLDEIQAMEVVVINVRDQTSVTDYMIICTGRSSRHVKAIAETAVEHMKAQGLSTLSLSGLDSGEWILVDFGDFVLHVMQADCRSFYNLEELWQNKSA